MGVYLDGTGLEKVLSVIKSWAENSFQANNAASTGSSGGVIRTEESFSPNSVSSGSTSTFDRTVTPPTDGAVPLGIAGFNMANGDKGSGCSYATFSEIQVETTPNQDGTYPLTYRVRAIGGSVSKCRCDVTVIWKV